MSILAHRTQSSQFCRAIFTRFSGAGAVRTACYGLRHGDSVVAIIIMPLTALLSAQALVRDGRDDSSVLAALLPVAGLTVLERQANAAVAAGCTAILVLVDAVPAALTAALDRLRGRGMAVIAVRSGADVLAALPDNAQLLLAADGLSAPKSLWLTMNAAGAPKLLAVADAPATSALERIDADRRWAGLALLDPAAVAALRDMPSDWDPQLALLRAAIQANAPTITCEAQLFERGDMSVVETAAAAALVEQRLLSAETDDVAGIVTVAVLMPLARAAAQPLLRGLHAGLIARLIAMTGAVISVAGFAALSSPMAAVGAALIGALATACARTIAAFQPESRALRRVGNATAAIDLLSVACLGQWAASTVDGVGRSSVWLAIWLAVSLALVIIVVVARQLAVKGTAEHRLLPDTPFIWTIILAALAVGPWVWGLLIVLPLAGALVSVALWRGARVSTKTPVA